MDTKPSPRNNYLDWLRVLAILFVFVYHSTRFFNLEDWHIKNPVTYEWVEMWNIFAWNWMMPLILVISGASLFYAVGKSGAGKFVKDKVLRLMVPFFVAIFTHATCKPTCKRPPIRYSAALTSNSYLGIMARSLENMGSIRGRATCPGG